MKIVLTMGLVAVAVSGCVKSNSGTSGVPRGTAAPTASSGYAGPRSQISDPAVTLSSTAKLQTYNPSTGAVTQTDVNLSMSEASSGTANAFVISRDGAPVTLTWDAVENEYSGVSGDLEYLLIPFWESTKGQVVSGYVGLSDYSPGGTVSWGDVVVGFNTSPAQVAGRTGSATYDGVGTVSITATDDSYFSLAAGPATLTANFDSNRVGGSMSLTSCPTCSSGVGAPTIASGTAVTIQPTSITGNTFATTATVTAADLGLTSVGTLGVDGMFYETNATGVGGTYSGTGATAGGTVLINGAFAAED